MSLPTTIAKLVQCARTFKSELGEAPIFIDHLQSLLWVDVLHAKLYVKDSTDTVTEHNLKEYTEHITTVVPVAEPQYKNTLILGTTEGFARYDLSTRIFEPHPSGNIHGVAETECQARSNDGKVDPCGRFWLGSLVRNLTTLDVVDKAGALYVLDTWNSTPTRVMEDITISNGLAWHENTMWYTDSPTAHIDTMVFNETDAIETICSTRQPRIKVSNGYPPVPDGCVVDKEGFVWSALFGAGCVRRYDPVSGEAVAEIALPKEAGLQSTACAWGGEHYEDLYITSAHEFWSEEECNAFPLAGCLFVCKADEIAEVCNATGPLGCPSFKFRMGC